MTESPPNLSRHSKTAGTENWIMFPPQLGFHQNNIATRGYGTPFSLPLSVMLLCAFFITFISFLHCISVPLYSIASIH